MSAGELILYRSQDGSARIQLRAVDGTVWLTQAEIAELFGITEAYSDIGQADLSSFDLAVICVPASCTSRPQVSHRAWLSTPTMRKNGDTPRTRGERMSSRLWPTFANSAGQIATMP